MILAVVLSLSIFAGNPGFCDIHMIPLSGKGVPGGFPSAEFTQELQPWPRKQRLKERVRTGGVVRLTGTNGSSMIR